MRNVTGIATQGYLYGSVTSYKIMYSVNAKQWVDYVDNTTMKSKVSDMAFLKQLLQLQS